MPRQRHDIGYRKQLATPTFPAKDRKRRRKERALRIATRDAGIERRYLS